MIEPKVSVIVPFYNVKEYIRECLDSLVAQTFSDFEVILIDDGSTDGSDLIAREYVEKNQNFFLYRQENRGLSAARNAGLEKAKGKYVFFLDSDDYIVANALQLLFQRAEALTLDVLNFESYTLEDSTKSIKAEPYVGRYPEVATGVQIYGEMKKSGDSRLISCCWVFIRRELIISHNLKFYEGIIHEDNLFQWLLMAVSNRVSVLQQPLYYHRNRKGSITMSTDNWFEKWKGLVISADEADKYVDKHPELKDTEMIWYIYSMLINAVNNGYMKYSGNRLRVIECAKLHFAERKIIWKYGWYKENHLLYYSIWPWGYRWFVKWTSKKG